MLPMRDLSMQRLTRGEGLLVIQAGRSARLQVFPKAHVVSRVAIRSEAFLVAIPSAAEAFRLAIPSVEAGVSTEVAAVDN